MDSKHYLVTKFGEVKLVPTSADHIFISTDTGEGQLVVNNVAYSASAHIYKSEDGFWGFTKDACHQPYMTRRNAWIEGKDPNPSFSAREKVKFELAKVVNEWVKTHAYVVQEANVDNLQKIAERAAAKVSEASKALADAHQEWEKAQEAYLAEAQKAA